MVDISCIIYFLSKLLLYHLNKKIVNFPFELMLCINNMMYGINATMWQREVTVTMLPNSLLLCVHYHK